MNLQQRLPVFGADYYSQRIMITHFLLKVCLICAIVAKYFVLYIDASANVSCNISFKLVFLLLLSSGVGNRSENQGIY